MKLRNQKEVELFQQLKEQGVHVRVRRDLKAPGPTIVAIDKATTGDHNHRPSRD